jgi:hypothetical protein
VKILKIYIYNEIKILKFEQSMKKMIMIKEKENFETGPLLKCVKLQVSNVFSTKLISCFFFKMLKMCTFWENLLESNLKFVIWKKYEKNNNGYK